jgi:hypothetical protein
MTYCRGTSISVTTSQIDRINFLDKEHLGETNEFSADELIEGGIECAVSFYEHEI